MLRSVLVRALTLTLPLTMLAVACDDGGDEGSTEATTTTTSSSTSGPGGAGGEGGNGSGGNGGEGGSVQDACAPADPDTYDGANFETNAAAELALRTHLTNLNQAMRNAEIDLTVTPSADELLELYDAGTPSLLELTTDYYGDQILSVLEAFAEAAGNTWTPAEPPVPPGGQYGAYIFSEYGTDLRQAVEKGLFGAVFYHHAVTLAGGTIDEATIDRMLAAFGAHPTFPGDSETTDPAVNPNPDRIGAQYAERRSPKSADGPNRPADPANPGPYFRIKADFIKAQAAARAGSACDAERDEAIQRILQEWERVNAATVIYYMNSASTQLTTDGAPTATLAAGLHGYGEGTAFLHGFRGLPVEGRIITDAQLDTLLGSIGAAPGETPTSYRLITDPAASVPNLVAAIGEIATIYGFTPQDVDAFKVNH
ncbi:hypothetical protein [Chondromyces apiculatus]|uniref:Lipoprotein n=1 Tax=Chondromyces apiculatus DSM 436 TaxID=1192034 RepID=A0A017SXJ7_9BACT|nr:hypothetical protein [Chondromyces apiculatus]EYF01678.1 Hypothetical protein CAP_7883 [Chondromyces apiculatus DSM 436]